MCIQTPASAQSRAFQKSESRPRETHVKRCAEDGPCRACGSAGGRCQTNITCRGWGLLWGVMTLWDNGWVRAGVANNAKRAQEALQPPKLCWGPTKLPPGGGPGSSFLDELPLHALQEQMHQPSPELSSSPPFPANPPPPAPFVLTPASLAGSQALWAATLMLNH